MAKRKGGLGANKGFNLQSTPSPGKGPRGQRMKGTVNAGGGGGAASAKHGFNIQSSK